MAVLSQLKPAEVFHYFEEISQIPRSSKNTQKMQQYILNFAKEQGLKSVIDKRGNIVIFKNGTAGRSEEAPIILQGHMDMVAVKTEEAVTDPEREPLVLKVEDGLVSAEGTSLGADNGIAVAYMLAILSSEKLSHPALECVFTTDEEIGLEGISEFDPACLNAKRMINLDAEEEGIMLTGCAGGIKVESHFTGKRELKDGILCKLQISGLTGGHSGTDIDKGRGNANVLLARVLQKLQNEIAMVSFNGGSKDNTIPVKAEAEFVVSSEQIDLLKSKFEKLEQEIKNEFAVTDPQTEFKFTGNEKEKAGISVFERTLTEKFLLYMNVTPNGVQGMSPSLPGLVETSLNMGRVWTKEDGFVVRQALRSSVKSRKSELAERLIHFAEYLGCEISTDGDYPPWEYALCSPLRDKMLSVYEEMYGTSMQVGALHAGLECGYMADKMGELDCVSIGPDIYDVHSTRERFPVESVAKIWNYLIKVLEVKD